MEISPYEVFWFRDANFCRFALPNTLILIYVCRPPFVSLVRKHPLDAKSFFMQRCQILGKKSTFFAQKLKNPPIKVLHVSAFEVTLFSLSCKLVGNSFSRFAPKRQVFLCLNFKDPRGFFSSCLTRKNSARLQILRVPRDGKNDMIFQKLCFVLR